MFTPNDQGYYQPYDNQSSQMPSQDQYQYPYIPPPAPAPVSTHLSNYRQDSFEMQNMSSLHAKKNSKEQEEKNSQNQKSKQKKKKTQVMDEYNTPTNTGEDNEDLKVYKTSQLQNGYIKSKEGSSQKIQKMIQINVRSGVLKLEELDGIYIKQKFELLEKVTSCEKPNSYKVYPADCNGDRISQDYIFKCIERSNCCSRNFLPGSKRPFNMIVKNKNGKISQSQDGAEDSNFIQLRRPYKCTCLCLSRPLLEVIIIENNINKLLGTISQPFYWCGVGLEIRDMQDNIRYTIEGNSCCMPAIWCRSMPGKGCQEAIFFIKDAKGEVLSYITKRATGCLKSCASDISNFGVTFPRFANPEDKVLIMSATLFLDYNYFEESNADRHDENSHINYTSANQNNKVNASSLSIPLNNFN